MLKCAAVGLAVLGSGCTGRLLLAFLCCFFLSFFLFSSWIFGAVLLLVRFSLRAKQ